MKNRLPHKTISVIIFIFSISCHWLFAQNENNLVQHIESLKQPAPAYIQDSSICYEWNSAGNWQKSDKSIKTYDANGKELQYISYYWDDSLLVWMNIFKLISASSINGSRVSSISQL